VTLAAAMLCPAALACAGKTSHPATASAAATLACIQTYVLTVQPSTIVSNEFHTIRAHAQSDCGGRQSPVRGATVRLLSYHAVTGSRGRCSLTVRLQTGRYLVRLYVHGNRVAHAPVSAIPVVAR
jgi:hypothetical protein